MPGLKAHPVVCGRAIKCGHGKVIKAEIDAELRTVMDLMVQIHGAEQE